MHTTRLFSELSTVSLVFTFLLQACSAHSAGFFIADSRASLLSSGELVGSIKIPRNLVVPGRDILQKRVHRPCEGRFLQRGHFASVSFR